jgi:uncharacterized protein
MTLHYGILLFLVATVAGAINSVAGGGSFLSFPSLLFTGVPPIQANATNTTALWPGTLASVGAYRKELRGEHKRMLIPLIITGIIGGLLGATILLKTPQATFLRLIPYLLGAATLLFAFSGQVSRFVRSRTEHFHQQTRVGIVVGALMQLCIAIYIGFFGAGAGILMLAMFAIMGVENIHTMNAYKTVLATVCNGIALLTFIVAHAILWPQAIVMTIGASIGGFYGAFFAQKMDPQHVRYIVIAIGAAMSIYFFAKTGF